jgi:hypothetical protein
VGVHVLAPAAEVAANPLPGAVAVMSLPEALAAGMTHEPCYLNSVFCYFHRVLRHSSTRYKQQRGARMLVFSPPATVTSLLFATAPA